MSDRELQSDPYPISRMYPKVWVKVPGQDDWSEDAKLLLLRMYFMHHLAQVQLSRLRISRWRISLSATARNIHRGRP